MRYTRSRFPFTSNDINFQSRGEIPISQNLISFFSVPRVIAGQEKWIITVWTNGICFNNFRLIFFSLFSFFLSFFSFFLFFFSFFFSLFSFLPIAMQKKLIIDNCFIGSTWFLRPIDYVRSHTTKLKLCTKSQCSSLADIRYIVVTILYAV